MKHILVPTDFSDYADNAGIYALHLASAFNAKITLFHAFHIPIIDPLAPSEYLSDLAEIAEKSMKEKLKEAVQKLEQIKTAKKLEDVEVGYYLRMGFAVDEIVSMTAKAEVDLIVMGRRYTQGMAKILLGSVTSAVLEEAKCPVLVVPENVEYEKTPDNVLYAAEYGEADKKTINRLLEFIQPFDSKIHAVHISEKAMPDAEQRLAELEVGYAKEVQNGKIIFFNVISENVFDGLSDYAERNNIGMLAMLTHKRSFFVKWFDRRFTTKVAFKTNIPLLVFHEK